MPHRRKPKRAKMDQQLITMEQGLPSNVVVLPTEVGPVSRGSNLVARMESSLIQEIEETIRQRFDSAEEMTTAVSKEIAKSERQFKGLFSHNSKHQEQEEYEEQDEDDIRIFMKKTLENIQIVFSHLDGLTSQLDPLLVLKPSISGRIAPKEEFKRAKVKELLVNFYLDKNRFRKDVLPRWRWNFLKHPSAYLRVLYNGDPMEPDIQIDLVDRGMLYIDPYIQTGDIKDAGWVIERTVVTRDEANENIMSGHWYLPGGVEDLGNMFAPPQDDVLLRILGRNADNSDYRGPDKDDMIEVLHYWQAEKRGMPHAYGVLLGGKNGELVRWGPNPYPYKGIPYRGKSYIRDPYRPDGISLANQYRSIQEVYNTFLNLRIDDVLENVKRRMHVAEQLFNENTQEDHENNQTYIRMAGDFIQQIMDSNKKLSDFMMPPTGGDSTQHLLSDLNFLNAEGRSETSVNDAFRGQSPQTGATLGQVQEQLQRALGVFRPVFSQEMALIEEIGQIVNEYFTDEDFFGEERIVSIIGPNRYKDVISDFHSEPDLQLSARRVTIDEMDVEVEIEVMNQAEHLASRTLRMQQRAMFFESLRHHPELAKEASNEINFSQIMMSDLSDMGEDIEAITYTDEQKKQRAERIEKERHQKMLEQIKFEGAVEQEKAQATAKGQVAVAQAKVGAEAQRDAAKIQLQSQADLEEVLAKANAENRAEMSQMLRDHYLQMQRMILEATLEIEANKQGKGISVQTGGNDINSSN